MLNLIKLKKAERFKQNYYADIEVSRAKGREIYQKNKVAAKEYYLKTYIIPEKRIKHLIKAAIYRAKQKKQEYDTDYLNEFNYIAHTNCPCCKKEFDYSAGKGKIKQSFSPSIDRIDNTKGYIRENVAIICMRCNQLKSNASVEDIINILRYMKHDK